MRAVFNRVSRKFAFAILSRKVREHQGLRENPRLLAVEASYIVMLPEENRQNVTALGGGCAHWHLKKFVLAIPPEENHVISGWKKEFVFNGILSKLILVTLLRKTKGTSSEEKSPYKQAVFIS
jgi:hypothetical protein